MTYSDSFQDIKIVKAVYIIIMIACILLNEFHWDYIVVKKCFKLKLLWYMYFYIILLLFSKYRKHFS